MNRSFVASLVLTTAFAVNAAAQTSTTTQTTGSASQKTSATAGKAGANAATTTGATANGAVKSNSQGAAANTAASAANQTSGALSVPPGTKIPAVLSKSIDSKKAKTGDKIEARTVADIVSQGKVVIPRDSRLLGHITAAEAKSSGGAESRLGIVFDQIMLKKGQTIPLQANIQAIGAAVFNNAATAGSGLESTGPIGGGASGSAGAGASGGGMLGGTTGAVGSTVGGAAGTVGGVAGGVTDTAGNTVGGVGSTVGAASQGTVGAAGNTVGVYGTLNSNSTGVVGLKDLQLSSATSSSAGGSVVTSSGKSVKLDSGSQLMLSTIAQPTQ